MMSLIANPDCEPVAVSPRPDRSVTVMYVGAARDDWSSLFHIFQHTNWTLCCASDYEEATELLRQYFAPVIITEARLYDGRTWQDFLQCRPPGGRPRLIVAANSQADSIWAEVLNCGGYDVLMKPFDQTEVVRVVSLAWLNWREELASEKLMPAPPACQSGMPRSPFRLEAS